MKRKRIISMMLILVVILQVLSPILGLAASLNEEAEIKEATEEVKEEDDLDLEGKEDKDLIKEDKDFLEEDKDLKEEVEEKSSEEVGPSKTRSKGEDYEFKYEVQEVEVEGKTYKGAVLSGLKDRPNETTIIERLDIPETIDGTKVIGIDSFAFNGEHRSYNIKELYLPSSLVFIGNYAFNRGPDSIDDGNMTKLVFKDIENSKLVKIGTAAFRRNDIGELKLPNSLEIIGTSAFDKAGIKSLDFQDIDKSKLRSIGKNALMNNSISSLELPASLEEIGSLGIARSNVGELKFHNIGESKLKTIGYYAFSENSLGSVELPASLVTIGERAFFRGGVESFKIHDIANSKLETIDEAAFYEENIKELELPNSLTYVGNFAFCKNDIEGELKFYDRKESKLKDVGAAAFATNKINQIILPDSIESLGNQAFAAQRVDYMTLMKLPNVHELDFEGLLTKSDFKKLYVCSNALTDNIKGKFFIEGEKAGEDNKVEYVEICNTNTRFDCKTPLNLDNLKNLRKILLYNAKCASYDGISALNERKIEVVGFENEKFETSPIGKSEIKMCCEEDSITKNGDEFKVTSKYLINEETRADNDVERLKNRPISIDVEVKGSKFLDIDNVKISYKVKENGIVKDKTIELKENENIKDGETLFFTIPQDKYFGISGEGVEENPLTMTFDAKVVGAGIGDEIDISSNISVTDENNLDEDIEGNHLRMKISEEASYELSFKAKDEAKSLDGAEIKVYEDKEKTKEVKDLTNLDPGKYYYTVEKDGFKSVEGSVEIKDKDKIVYINLEKIEIETVLNDKDHFRYIAGYPDGSIRPDGKATREEIAAMFYRLLDENVRNENKEESHEYPDFPKKYWSARYVGTLSKMNILVGYPDGNFRNKDNITRAEFASLIVRLINIDSLNIEELNKEETFKLTDIEGHWAEKDIRLIKRLGWVIGYEDHSFKPDQAITRAEIVTIINNILKRDIRLENIPAGIKEFTDLNEGKWYYTDFVEATNGHIYEDERLKDGSEIWKELKDFNNEM